MISIYGPAIKTNYWLETYESFCKSGIPFEIIFAGFNRPTFELPDNFKFIYTDVKMSQASEAARRQCSGDFIFLCGDDFEIPPDMLKRYMNAYESSPDKNIIVSGLQAFPDRRVDINHHMFAGKMLPFMGMVNREWNDKIGSIDRRFIGSVWDIDLYLRFYELGGKLQFIEDLIMFEKDGHPGLFDRWSGRDWPVLHSIWGNGYSNRISPVDSFEDENILTTNQGTQP